MSTGARNRATWRALLIIVTASLTVFAGCTANPPPPIETTDSPKTTQAKPGKSTVVVAIDTIGIGFNPHLRSDQSPASAALSSMVLPSPFRPVPNQVAPGVTDWVPDTSLLASAEVSAQDPFTITYTLRNEANWSDGAPIAAEDFQFLWQQMISQPGVIDSAGYRLITDIGSADGGKLVTVKMREPYPAWQQLFTNLLPSHLMKDSPGGFQDGWVKSIRVSGSQFAIKNVDPQREEVLLERNARFWGTPAAPDEILLRRGGTPAQLAESLRTNDAQMTLVHGGVATQAQLAAIPSVRTAIMPQSRVLQLALNARTGPVSDIRVRRAVLALLDPALLATVGAQTGGWVEPARAQILSPSDPGYAPTSPPRPPAEESFALLAEAGYGRAPEPPPVNSPTSPAPTPRPVAKNGKSLSIRIGAAEGDTTAIAVANTAADQLRSAGIDATVRGISADQLYGRELVEGTVDAIVGWERAGSDPATVLASRYGCPPPEPGTGSAGTAQQSSDPARRAPANLSGVCDPALQLPMDEALRGIDTGRVLAEAEPKLWELATVLPIVQDNVVAAAGPRVDGASLSGSIQVGIFGDAGQWRKIQ